MTGLYDIVFSFAISYIAGSIPTDWFSRDNNFENKLEKCYQIALKKWTVNSSINNKLSHSMLSHLADLKKYLLTKPIDKPKDIDKLIAMWANELHNDPHCYCFILENKIDFINVKLDTYYSDLKNSTLKQQNTIQEIVESNGNKLDEIQLLLSQITQNQQCGNIEEQIKFINNIVGTNIKDLIDSLHTSTALSILNKLEVMYSEVISKDKNIATKIGRQKQLCADLSEGKLSRIIDIKNTEKEIQSIILPDTLTLENLSEWIYALNLHRIKIGSIVTMDREYVKEKAEYKKAFAAADKFYALLNRTEIVNGFPFLRALYCYWGFLVEGSSEWLIEYQSIDKNTFCGQKYYFQLIEATMLYMVDKPEAAFALAVSIKDDIDTSYVNFIILLGYHTKKKEYTLWALNLAVEKQIKIDQEGSSFIGFSISKETANQLLDIIPQLNFENEAEKSIVTQLCNSNLGHNVNTLDFKNKVDTVSEDMQAYAAMLMAQDGEVNLAFKLLNSKIEVGKMDFKQRSFINILSMSDEYRPHLYRLLKQNREQGITTDDLLLLNEFTLAMKVSDFDNALETISILYGRKPKDEMVLVNYINALSLVYPEKLLMLQEIVKSFEFIDPDSVENIYIRYAENNYLEFATEFIVTKQRSMNNEKLNFVFFTESTTGFIRSIVEKEYEDVEEGLCVLYSVGEERDVVVARSTTPLGRILIGKNKGDTVIFLEKELHIEAIYSKYYKGSFDYIREVTKQGGNQFLRMGKFDIEHPLESLQAMIREVNPDCINDRQRKCDALQKYENGEIGLIQLVDDNHIIGSYYRMLFTSFKVNILPAEIYIDRCSQIKSDTNFLLDLPACILLFEFAQKAKCSYRTRFQVSKHLYELIKETQKHARVDLSLDFYEGIKSGHVKRFDDHVDTDSEIRLNTLLEWIDKNCEVNVVTEALAISKATESRMSSLFSSTLVGLIDTNNYLISDEGIYEKLLLKGQVPIISTEAFISLTEDELLAKEYSNFLFECRFEGVHLEKDFIVKEYFKMENGKDNRFPDIIQNGFKNPFVLIEAINAGLDIAQDSQAIDLAKITLTNMFALIIRNYNTAFIQSQLMQQIQQALSYQSFNFKLVQECINDAIRMHK